MNSEHEHFGKDIELNTAEQAELLYPELEEVQISIDDIKEALRYLPGNPGLQDALQETKDSGAHIENAEMIADECSLDLERVLQDLETYVIGDTDSDEYYVNRILEIILNNSIEGLKRPIAKGLTTEEESSMFEWVDSVVNDSSCKAIREKNPNFYDSAREKAVQILVLIATRSVIELPEDIEKYFVTFGDFEEDELQAMLDELTDRAMQSVGWNPYTAITDKITQDVEKKIGVKLSSEKADQVRKDVIDHMRQLMQKECPAEL